MLRIVMIIFTLVVNTYSQNAWINELHYDNDGGDAGEFVEVAIENVNLYNLGDFTVTFYNGSDGAAGYSHKLDSFTEGETDNNITLYYKNIPGIQNGAPDGLSLDYVGTIIQFLSYEGTFTAISGVANAMTSIDIGVYETTSSPLGFSLQLIGSGTQYKNFTWTSPGPETKGIPNNSQALPVELTTFSASISYQNVELSWETATEVNNYGFEVERASSPLSMNSSQVQTRKWEIIGFVEGNGNSNSPKYYSYSDNEVQISGKYFYRLKQVDIDGKHEYSDEIEVNVKTPNNFALNQNFPNPFNPTTLIQFNIPLDSEVRLSVYNILGEEVAELLNTNITAGYHKVNFDGGLLNSGIYFYKLETNDFTQIRKMLLVK